MSWTARGRVWKFGDNIPGDAGIFAFDKLPDLSLTDPVKLAPYCMTPIDPTFPTKVKKGDIMVVGKNFGTGKLHIQAPLSIIGCGISCVVAESISRQFFRKSVNYGLPLVTCKGITEAVETGDTLEVQFDIGKITNLTNNRTLSGDSFPDFIIDIMKAGGTNNYLRDKLKTKSMVMTPKETAASAPESTHST